VLFDKEIQISPAEWQMWSEHPVTIKVFETLAQIRDQWSESLIFGQTLIKAGCEIKDTANAVGVVRGLTVILDDLEQLLNQQWEEYKVEREREENKDENESEWD
jgi:hypothetical protein